MSWSIARIWSTSTPCLRMIAALTSTSPWVWLGSGLFLSVQLTKVAFSPVKSRSTRCPRGSRGVTPAPSRCRRSRYASRRGHEARQPSAASWPSSDVVRGKAGSRLTRDQVRTISPPGELSRAGCARRPTGRPPKHAWRSPRLTVELCSLSGAWRRGSAIPSAARSAAAGAGIGGRCRRWRRRTGRRRPAIASAIWACHSSRNATISSWSPPTKFHHMTICSARGSPPRRRTRAPSAPAARVTPPTPQRGRPARGAPGPRRPPEAAGVGEEAVLEVASTAADPAPRARTSSAPRSGVCVVTGEVSPSSVPRKTWALSPRGQPGPARCSKPGSTSRRAAGSATHSWTPCSVVGRRGRDLGVADAAAGRHQVELAGAHHGLVPSAVAVLDLPREQPADRLQAGVRVRRDAHAAGLGRRRPGRSGRGSTRRRSATGAAAAGSGARSSRAGHRAAPRGRRGSRRRPAPPLPRTRLPPDRPPGCSCPQSALPPPG